MHLEWNLGYSNYNFVFRRNKVIMLQKCICPAFLQNTRGVISENKLVCGLKNAIPIT